MREIIVTVILAAATYRVSSLLSNEDGPLNVIEKVRNGLNNGNQFAKFWGTLMSCPYCNSVWIGCAFGFTWATALELHPTWLWTICGGLAFSTYAIYLNYKIPYVK